MGELLVRCLALFLLLGSVSSQGRDILKAKATLTTPSNGLEIAFPNDDESVPVAARVTTPARRNKATTSSTTTTTTTTTSPPGAGVNSVEEAHSYELASNSVHNVATSLHHIVDPSGSKNYVISPFSVTLLTAQMLLAARGDSERRLRILLTGSSPPRAASSEDTQRTADLELHNQLGGLLKSLVTDGKGQNVSYRLEADSAFFINNDLKLKSSFQQSVTDLYGSDFLRLNFSEDPGRALKDMNEWANLHTNGRIPSVYSSPLPRHTAVVLINSVYFRSEWETPFDPELTVPGVFRLNATHQIKVQNMRGQVEDILFVDHKELNCRMMVLPYKSPDVNMYVILPNKDIADMKDFAGRLSTSNITTLIKAASLHSVTVVLPKMALSATYSLKDPIMKYKPQKNPKDGLKPRIFTRVNRRNRTTTTTTTPSTVSSAKPTRRSTTTSSTTTTPPPRRTTRRSATTTPQPPRTPTNNNNTNKPWFDLSGASTDERFRVNDILHQISLEVTETGTEAAAITTGSVDYSLNGKVFKADRPFLFFIRHEPSLVTLFYAVVMDPTNGNYD